MAHFRGIQEYIALDANNITLVFDAGNIVNISGNIFLYPPQGHPILYKYLRLVNTKLQTHYISSLNIFFITQDMKSENYLEKIEHARRTL